MPINVKISLCKITRASKLFQRNYYLPLLKPLSPKDALRLKIITGQNVLGNRIEHYIPVLKPQEEKIADHRRHGKGPVIKKKVKRNENIRYVEPFLDENMENHGLLRSILSKKPRGKGQCYVYDVPDKKCALVVSYQMEKALKDKDIVDITMAQRSEKILVKLSNGLRITVPVAPMNDSVTFYRGSGWTKEYVELEHHHGKETMSIAKLFEAKESGVEDWELEMMRLANKRKKKVKGEDSKDWKMMLTSCVEDMDWDKFEEDTKQIVEDQNELVQEENIPMAVDDMEKTKHVNEKLKAAGQDAIDALPIMTEIPSIIKNLETGEVAEIANVSGAMVQLPTGRKCFVTGQMVKNEEEIETFVPGQTVEKEDGAFEYTPGITINMDNEPTLIPGLVMGDEEQPPMFLPGESTITEEGQLKFEATEEDLTGKKNRALTPSPPPTPKPRPKVEEEIVIKRRVFDEPEPVVHERVRRRLPIELPKEPSPPRRRRSFTPYVDPMEETLRQLEEERRRREEEEKKRFKERMEEKILKEETKVNQLRMNIRKKCKEMKFEKAVYVPVQPVKKSQKLEELEQSIKKGTFFEDDKTKEILERARLSTRMMKYQHILGSNDWR